MRRTMLFMTVMALVVLAAAPASAHRVEKTSYIVAECPDVGNPLSIDRMWSPTEDSVHIRGGVNLYYEYLYTGSGWTGPFAENTTVANLNAAFPSFEGSFWGTWSFDDYDGGPDFGDFDGKWVFTNNGAAKGTGMSNDGRVAKVSLGLESPAPPVEGCGVVEFLIFDK
jgi:hypothetical protein